MKTRVSFSLPFLFLCIVFVFVARMCAKEKLCANYEWHLSPLEHAIQQEPVAQVQKYMRAGFPLTVHACELAGKRMSVVQFLYEYFQEAVADFRAGMLGINTRINLSREQLYACMDALLLHTYDVHYVRDLLLLGARTDHVDKFGNNAAGHNAAGHYALFYARQQGHEDTARILLHEDEKIYEQLLILVQEKKLTREFLKKYFSGLNRQSINRAYPQLGWHTVLYDAVEHNYYDGVLLLLEYGAMGLQEILPVALRHADKKILQFLVHRGARLHNIPDFLSDVIRENPSAHAIVEWLAPLASEEQRNRALITACLGARDSLVVLLLNMGAQAVYEDSNGVSALWAAVVGHDLGIVRRIAAGKHISLTAEQLKTAKTLFPVAYAILVK